ncbi:TrmB family transcriptional regulator [Celerinatantimonas sp. YJH-8]|uniref:TrmB family transcriptional regulator n=1 Tax=Celerinatantimonas sp. YJH-8 TaxID=3228714 RepID=UPI0038C028E6
MIEKFGFSKNESQVYETILVSDEALDAAAVAKHSGVPKAKVYEVITKLLDKGMLLDSMVEKKKLYRAISIEQVVQKLTTQFESDIEQLKQTQWKKAKPDNRVWNLNTGNSIHAYGMTLLDNAQHSIQISTWSDIFFSYLPMLEHKEQQGVQVEAHVVGAVESNLKQMKFFIPAESQTKLKKYQNIIVDGKELLFAVENEEESNSIITQSEQLIDVFRDFFYRDLILTYLDENYHDTLYNDRAYVELINNLSY